MMYLKANVSIREILYKKKLGTCISILASIKQRVKTWEIF